MRVDPPSGVHELQNFESEDWRTRTNPGLPREYLHVRPKQQTVRMSLNGEDAERNVSKLSFQEGDHVWLAVDPMATLKNGSCLLRAHEHRKDRLGPSSGWGRPTSMNDELPTKLTGLVKKVQHSSGDCLVEWGVVGHCPAGMPRKLLWCTSSELKKAAL